MKKILVFALVVLSIVLFSVFSIEAYNLLPTFFPEVYDYSAPNWLNEGVRLVYRNVSGSIPHDKYRYFDIDENRLILEEHAGTGGHGIYVTDVISLEQII